MNTPTFYWHDYETSGADKIRDRPLQFAGIRTTLDLIPVGEPTMIYCKPAPETLPHLGACLITGLTPQECEDKGLREADFAKKVHDELSLPGTCGAGYNSLRFDDEITRNLFYRNFFEPYDREWQNGNSRWDLIDLSRLCYALRPDGIEWPLNEEGNPSFRLEDLAKANRLEQTRAHDALSDVEATISLARLYREKQKGVFDFYFTLRKKQNVLAMVDTKNMTPLVHVSSFYPSSRGCLSVVAPLASHATQSNGFIVFDLMADPTPLIELDAEALAEKVFQTGGSNESERLPLSVIQANRSPALTPTGTLKGVDLKRINLDLDVCRANLNRLKNAQGLKEKVQAIFNREHASKEEDPETSLYSGFPTEHDKRLIREVRETRPEALVGKSFAWKNQKYEELLFRYRARNWPELLSEDEKNRWQRHRVERLTTQHPASSLTLAGYHEALVEARKLPQNEKNEALFEALEAWGSSVEHNLTSYGQRPKP